MMATAPLLTQSTPSRNIINGQIIHESLLRHAIHRDIQQKHLFAIGDMGGTGAELAAASVPAEDEIVLEEVETLALGFRSLLCIDNLQGCSALTKLQLDNNQITRIENLEYLVNLTWLDLSFNQITVIEGLETLKKLTDLSLFNNRITHLTGLDGLTELNILSVGNNELTSLEEIKTLRAFEKLRHVHLKGNPVTQLEEYNVTVLAFIPQLRYLDYTAIDPIERAKARDARLEQLSDLERKETDERRQRALEIRQQALQTKYREANIDSVLKLYDEIVDAGSNELSKLRLLPGFEKLISSYKQTINDLLQQFIDDMLGRHAVKLEEYRMFNEVYEYVKKEAHSGSISAINEYNSVRKRLLASYEASLDEDDPRTEMLDKLHEAIDELYHKLMDMEMLLVERTHILVEEFDKAYMNLVQDNFARIGTCFRALGDVNSKHSDNINDLVSRMLEAFMKDDISIGTNITLRALLADRDALQHAVSTINDINDVKVNQKEDEVRDREELCAKELIDKVRLKEYQRNRQRVAEICELRTREEQEIKQRLSFDEQDDR